MREENVEFGGLKGKKMKGVFLYPDDEKPPGIMMVHGFGGEGLSPYWIDTAKDLCKKGFCVFTFLFSGYNDLPDMRDVGIMDEVREMKIAMNFFQKKTGRKNFFVFAQSLGSFVSVITNDRRVKAYSLLAFNPRLKDSISRVLFTDEMVKKLENGENCEIKSISTGQLRVIGPKFWKDLKKFGNISEKNTGKVKKPVLLLWGTKDEYTSPEEAVEIYEMFGEPKKIFMLEGAPHVTFREAGQRKIVLEEVRKWFDNYDS